MASGWGDFHKQLTHNSFRQQGLSLVGLNLPYSSEKLSAGLTATVGRLGFGGWRPTSVETTNNSGHYDNGQVEFLGQYKDGWLDTVVKKDNCWSHPMRFQILDQ